MEDLLTIKDLSHDFRDKIWYKNVNFKVFKNEHIVILGANGAGNSILMKLLTGAYLPEYGQIIWHSNIKVAHLNQYATLNQE